MKIDHTRLSKAIQTTLSMGAVAAVGTAGTAAAQSAAESGASQPTTLQTVVVTGSHIRRVDLETSNPVVAVTSQQIEATGAMTLGDVVDQMPVITGAVQRPTVNNGGGSGDTLVGLRGLGSARTLILVDGQRVQNKDLNSIPSIAVERVEVLTSGASSIYGSDAIGGVINFILKSNYQGAQVQLNYGESSHHDGKRRGGVFMFGQTSDKGSILAGAGYNKFDPVLMAARDFSKDQLTLVDDGHGGLKTVVGGSTFAARDQISVGEDIAAQFGCATGGVLSLNETSWAPANSPTTNADYHCYQQSDGYNYAAVNLLMTPQERTNAFFKGIYHLSEHIDFYGTYYHNKTASGFQLAPSVFGTPTASGVVISKDSYYNPFGVDFSSKLGNLYRSRLYPVGVRAARNNNTTDQLIMGLRGDVMVFDQDWIWDVGYNYGHQSTVQAILGLPDQTKMLPGLGPSMFDPASQSVVCVATPGDLSSVISGCTPWDPFNLNSPSAQAILPTVASPGLVNLWSIEKTYHADISGGLFTLPAGTIQLAAGASYRTEYSNNTVGPALVLNQATGTCQMGSQCTAHLQGGFNVKEAYAEVFIPILQGLPLVSSLNATLGDRYSKFSTFGSTNNWKVAIEYRPIDDLLLRGTVSSIFRAPTISDVFGAPVSNAPLLTSDPCDHITTPGNPACVGVPTDGSFVNRDVLHHQQIQGLNSGSAYANFPLGPEKGKSFDFGAVYSPNFVPGLSFSADFWRIYLSGTITQVGVQTVLDMCFNGSAIYCPLITRIQGGASAGQVLRMTSPTANLGRIDVKGVDLSANYRLPMFWFGQIRLGLNATYLTQFKLQTAPGQAGNQVLNGAGVMGAGAFGSACPGSGGNCFYPRVRAQGVVNWQLGDWNAQWRIDYTSRFHNYGAAKADRQEGINNYGAYVYNHVMVGYSIEPINTKLELGVDNVFDKKHGLLFIDESVSADATNFDAMGRYYWGRVTVRF